MEDHVPAFITGARWDIQLGTIIEAPAQGVDPSNASHFCEGYSSGW